MLITLVQALQHVLTIYSNVVLVPIIVANSIGVPAGQIEYIVFASLIVTSISTLIQAVRFGKIGAGYTLFMGTSGAFLVCSLAAAKVGGMELVATMAIISAPFEFLLAYFLGRFHKIINSAVGGVVIMLVPVTLVPIAIDLWMGQAGRADYGSTANLLVGAVTFAVILALAIFGNTAVRLWSPLIGMAAGYLFAGYMGIVDLSAVREAAFIGLPHGSWPGIALDFRSDYWPILIAFIIVTLVGTVETVGDVMAVQRVSERNFKKINYESVQGGLYADGLGNFLAGLAGTVPNTTYSGNISMIELTGVASRQVGIYGAAIVAVLAFFPKLSLLIINIPVPILGVVLLIFMSMLFVTGLQVATMDGVDYQTMLLIGLSFWIGFVAQNGLFFPKLIPSFIAPLVGNGIAAGGTAAFILSIVFRLIPKNKINMRLEATPDRMERLQQSLNEMTKKIKISNKTMLTLQLLCEEVFIHLCNANRDNQADNRVLFTFTEKDNCILVEVQDRSAAEDVDFVAVPENIALATPQELDKLGLALLGKLAGEVSHIHISGVNYISFKVYKV